MPFALLTPSPFRTYSTAPQPSCQCNKLVWEFTVLPERHQRTMSLPWQKYLITFLLLIIINYVDSLIVIGGMEGCHIFVVLWFEDLSGAQYEHISQATLSDVVVDRKPTDVTCGAIFDQTHMYTYSSARHHDQHEVGIETPFQNSSSCSIICSW